MDFLTEIVELTGLPKEELEKDVSKMINERGFSFHEMTLEKFREILATYMQDALLRLKKDFET